ncbi:MAG: hypothetical protein WC472_04215 [Candidatus Paceibacterota bacterium]
MNLIEKLKNVFYLFKKKIIIIVFICLISSAISTLCIPIYINKTFTPEIINEQINLYFVEGIDTNQIILGLTWIFQLSIISGFLLIIAYIFKYDFDKRIFNIKKWQDWKFFLYATAFPIILIDLIKKLEISSNLNLFNNFFSNFFINLACSLIIVILIPIIIKKEEAPIFIDIEKIEKELTENNKTIN